MSVESYWATGRSREVMSQAIENSLVVGLYSADGGQAGFARMVTDHATFGWLCDVFVGEEHRGNGAGSFLVQTIIGHPDVAGIRQVLMARPGRTLYRRYGFGELISADRWMERPAKPGR